MVLSFIFLTLSTIRLPALYFTETTLIKVPDVLTDPVDNFPFLAHQQHLMYLISPLALKHFFLGFSCSPPVALTLILSLSLGFFWFSGLQILKYPGASPQTFLLCLLSFLVISSCLMALNIIHVLMTPPLDLQVGPLHQTPDS